MELAKFIARKPEEKEVISLRIPSDTLKMIDEKSAEIDISRNEFINQALLFALANMEDASESESEE